METIKMTMNGGNQRLVADPISVARSGDWSAIARMDNYLASGNIMQMECLSHADFPCKPLHNEMHGEQWNKGCEPHSDDERAKYFPQELVGSQSHASETHYYCYLIKLQPNFQYDVKPQDILLAVQKRLDNDLEELNLDLDVDRGKLVVHVKHVGYVTLTPEQVALCRQFQDTIFRVLLKRDLDKLHQDNQYSGRNSSTVFNYLLLPSLVSHQSIAIDWKCIKAVLYQKKKNASCVERTDCCSSRGYVHRMHTKNGLACCCILENSLVCTPHNGFWYCIKGTLDGVDGNTYFVPKNGESVTYKKYYKQRHGISLQFERQTLLSGRHIFTVQKYRQRCRNTNAKEPSNNSCELPPELCSIIMSPVSISTIYSFSFLPCVMHRIEALLIAANLRSIPVCHCMQNVVIPTHKVLEAITTKKCQEELHLESLETLGDSFLKYAASQQLFKMYQNHNEGLLTLERQRIISNTALCKLGCDRKIPGFIRDEPFDPKTWIIPGKSSAHHVLEEERLSSCKIVYSGASRKIKSKRVADVVEALIGAFLSAGGEIAALSFMAWLGINVDFIPVPYTRTFFANPEKYVNIGYLESLLKYSFRDASLLVEALTHGSYTRPEIPRCYQRLEFLGDAVLDYLITVHFYHKYPDLSPGLLTDLRSASVNNDCYGQSAIKAGLHSHILYLSSDLHRHIAQTVSKFEELQLVETFGWESETILPKVLGDVVESLAGAIFVDSGGDKEIVFQSMRPLLEPLVTVETLKPHPESELNQLCQKEHYNFKKPVVSWPNGVANATVEVEVRGTVYRKSSSAPNKKMAEKLACKAVLKSLKESMSTKLN